MGIRRWCNGILSFFLSMSRAYARSWPRWTAAQLAIPLHFRRTWSLEQSRPTFLAHSPFSRLLCPFLALLLARSNSHGHRPSTPSNARPLPGSLCSPALSARPDVARPLPQHAMAAPAAMPLDSASSRESHGLLWTAATSERPSPARPCFAVVRPSTRYAGAVEPSCQ